MISKNLKNFLTFIRYKFEYLNIHFLPHPFKIYEYLELLRDVRILKSDIILDLGCGNGHETLLIGKKCQKIYGIDIFKENMAKARFRSQLFKKKVDSEFKLIKLENANFNSEFFDIVFSICVLEHISNYSEVLSEVYRTLKNGGQMIFSVDSLENIKNTNFIRFHKKKHFIENYFNKEDLFQTLEEIGFKNIRIYPIWKSKFAKKLFINLTLNTTFFDYLISNLTYIRLKKKESKVMNINTGLYLIVKCFK